MSHSIVPRCVHFNSCGGCQSQDIPYEEQLRLKEQLVRDCLAPFLNESVQFYPIIGCEPPWQYRNKMEFTFSEDKAGNRYLGLIMKNNRGRVLNISECHLVNSWFLDAIRAVRHWWEKSGLAAYHPRRDTGSLRTLIVREGKRSGDQLVMLTVSGNPEYALKRDQLDDLVKHLRESIRPLSSSQLSIFLRIQQAIKGKPTQFYEMLLYGADHIREELSIKEQKLMFKISPTAFFQPNTFQAETIYSRALEMLEIDSAKTVYDLYCGTATLGICLARSVKHILSVEISPESIIDARENIKNNKIENLRIIQGDVGKVLSQLALENQNSIDASPDIVVVDPPRMGLDSKALESIIALKAPQLLYISCNPITQAANLELLLKEGYRLKSVQPIDQFPQTRHLENIVVLVKT